MIRDDVPKFDQCHFKMPSPLQTLLSLQQTILRQARIESLSFWSFYILVWRGMAPWLVLIL
jgi:hypothetical protein